ncbi:group II truncated hemoglobin [Alteraurantiacibacter buctensis]|uniref:Globin n=1 Tax=Alteraurantiacibacter buctensis TaxID=1503981 RepID=A0A844YWU4_9SPHN|nr:group II truncated hemoglobin [Alteraurantiacibacter buctensis]MXO70547.1 globin [Alteraurantiacibacter buctensis]
MDTSAPELLSPYDQIGGADGIRRIVDRFYDLMEQDPAYAELRAMHADELGPMRAALAGFLGGWAGGPRDWFDANPGKCMMSMHGGLAITPGTARQWVQAMERAFADCGMADHPVALLMNERFRMMAGGMAATDLDG